ncbi:MAG: hypothetical protein WC557_01430 [Ignavibacteriaceae bacterium]
MKLDSYNLFARAFPAILCGIPFFILYFFLLRPIMGEFWSTLFNLKIISDITFSAVLLFFLLELNRIISKELFENKIYRNGLTFPTTNFLLHQNQQFSEEYLQKIHKKIKSDFGITIPNRHKEIKNEYKSRKQIVEAVNHMRIKVGKGKLLGQHNIEYGFFRNFAGGTLIATVASLFNIIIFRWIYFNNQVFLLSFAFLIVYLFLSLFSKKIINITGQNYARVLIQEYMSLVN